MITLLIVVLLFSLFLLAAHFYGADSRPEWQERPDARDLVVSKRLYR